MTKLLTYLGNDAGLVRCAIHNVQDDLDTRDGDGRGGWGLGYTQESRVLVRQHPASRHDVDLVRLTGDLRTRSFITRFVTADAPAVPSSETQPFRFKSWLFAQTGSIGSHLDPGDIELSDFQRRGMQSDAAGEWLFHRFLHYLSQHGGRVQTPRLDPKPAAAAMRQVLSDIAESDKETTTSGIAAVAIGRRGVVATAGVPAYARMIAGIEPCPVCTGAPLFAGHKPKPHRHSHYKACLVTDKLRDSAEGWLTIPAGSLALLSDDSVEILEASTSDDGAS